MRRGIVHVTTQLLVILIHTFFLNQSTTLKFINVPGTPSLHMRKLIGDT